MVTLKRRHRKRLPSERGGALGAVRAEMSVEAHVASRCRREQCIGSGLWVSKDEMASIGGESGFGVGKVRSRRRAQATRAGGSRR